MDSLSQFALGAAVGQATLGRSLGRRALWWGGLLGTLPDLDVLIPMGGPMADFTYHRSWSHSILVHAVVAPVFARLVLARARQLGSTLSLRQAGWAVFFIFATHAVRDAMTIYGTQLFWPIPMAPIGMGSVFIIDPLYTVPLLITILWAAFLRTEDGRQRVNRWGLRISSGYLIWSLVAQQIALGEARRSLDAAGVRADPLVAIAAPLNTLSWRFVAIDGDRYLEGYTSLIDGAAPDWYAYPRERAAVAAIGEHEPVQRLQWFTKGAWAASVEDDDLIVADLRMGLEPDYVFRFRVAERDADGAWQAIPEELERARFGVETLGWTWRRITTPEPKPGATPWIPEVDLGP